MTVDLSCISAMVERHNPFEGIYDIHMSSGTIFTTKRQGQKIYDTWVSYTLNGEVLE
jgi:hypothetical protein